MYSFVVTFVGDIDKGDIDKGDIDKGDIDKGDVEKGDVDKIRIVGTIYYSYYKILWLKFTYMITEQVHSQS